MKITPATLKAAMAKVGLPLCRQEYVITPGYIKGELAKIELPPEVREHVTTDFPSNLPDNTFLKCCPTIMVAVADKPGCRDDVKKAVLHARTLFGDDYFQTFQLGFDLAAEGIDFSGIDELRSTPAYRDGLECSRLLPYHPIKKRRKAS